MVGSKKLRHRRAAVPGRTIPAGASFFRGVLMKRGLVLSVVVGIGMLSLAVAAQQAGQPPAPKVVEVEKVKDNLFMMKGGGGNSAVFITSTGIVVVDSKNAGWGQ